MNKQNKYIISGPPTPCQRPRFSNGVVYDSQKQIKLIHGLNLRHQHNNAPLFDGSIELELKFIFKWPLKTPEKGKKELRYHIFKPDLDNLVKHCCDIANGILWKDDCIVSRIIASKIYGDQELTEMTIRQI